MNKSLANKIIDLVMAFDSLGLIFTGIIMKWVLPPGTGGRYGYGRGWGRWAESADQVGDLWGLGRHDWGSVHFYLACVFLGLLVLHTILHWGWIKAAYFRFGKSSRGRH